MSEPTRQDQPAAYHSADIEFRPMQREDIDVGLHLCRLAGWDQGRRDWERFVSAGNVRTSVAFSAETHPPSPDGLVATSRIIGTVATIRYGAEFGWIGMLLVHPDVQGRGVGAVLLEHATAELANLPSIRLDATPAGRALYRKHGFVDECSLRRMESMPSIDDQLSQARVQVLTHEDLADVIALDREVFGAPRADLLAWMQEGAPEFGFVARHDERVTGYLLGRHGHEFEHLGPIVALDPAGAVELTRAGLAASRGRRVVIDSVSDAEPWRRFLEQTGFSEQRPYVRMYRGRQPAPAPRSQQFAILGPEFG